jgi:hypothetical protein
MCRVSPEQCVQSELTTKAAGILDHGQEKYPSTLMLQLIAAMM